MKTKTAPNAAASRPIAPLAKSTRVPDTDDLDVLQIDSDETVSAATLKPALKGRQIRAAKAASEDDDDNDDLAAEEEEAESMPDDDDTPDDDELDKEFAEFDLPKSNRGAGKKTDGDEMDEEFRDLGIDTGGGGGYDDDDDDF